jgi:hypothetical protein
MHLDGNSERIGETPEGKIGMPLLTESFLMCAKKKWQQIIGSGQQAKGVELP